MRLRIAMMVVAALAVTAFACQAVPLRPDIVDRLRAEGRLEEEAALMEEAYSRGVNNPRYFTLPGMLGSGAGVTAMTNGRAIVLIVDFDDNVANETLYPNSHYEELLFSIDTYPSGSMRDYYLENSYSNFDVTGEASGWHRMPNDYAYYVDGQRGFGSYPRNARKLAEDAIAAADPVVDFSQYDNDGPDGVPDSGDDDGFVDALFVVHAGPGYETTGDVNDIHSHAWATASPVPVDGVYAYRYSMEPDDGRIGVFCHEFGHVLGLPDLYDYDYDSGGVGYWSLMASGSWGAGGTTPTHFDAWSKVQLGFVTPIVPTANLIEVPVERVEDNPVIYKVWSDGAAGNEYFLFEHRRKYSFDFYVPAKGIVIYHVDENMPGNDNQLCGPGSPHYLVAVEQADGECDLEYDRNTGDAGDPWPGSGGIENPNGAFNLLSTPNTNSYSDDPTGVSIYNIHFSEGTGYVSVAVSPVGPYAEVVSPNGGESFETGVADTIRWIAFDDLAVDSVNIWVSIDGGISYPYLVARGEANDSMLVWEPDCPGSPTCRLKVVAYDNDGNAFEDVSDADFTIVDLAGIAGGAGLEFGIVSVSPNPTLSGTRVVFASPSGNPGAGVYDITGRFLKSLPVARVSSSAGTYQADWDGRNTSGRAVAPGVYFVRIASEGKARTARVTITR
jgi:M6 family metalloprotease-like protein